MCTLTGYRWLRQRRRPVPQPPVSASALYGQGQLWYFLKTITCANYCFNEWLLCEQQNHIFIRLTICEFHSLLNNPSMIMADERWRRLLSWACALLRAFAYPAPATRTELVCVCVRAHAYAYFFCVGRSVSSSPAPLLLQKTKAFHKKSKTKLKIHLKSFIRVRAMCATRHCGWLLKPFFLFAFKTLCSQCMCVVVSRTLRPCGCLPPLHSSTFSTPTAGASNNRNSLTLLFRRHFSSFLFWFALIYSFTTGCHGHIFVYEHWTPETMNNDRQRTADRGVGCGARIKYLRKIKSTQLFGMCIAGYAFTYSMNIYLCASWRDICVTLYLLCCKRAAAADVVAC